MQPLYTDRRKRDWWQEPSLPKRTQPVPRALMQYDPTDPAYSLPTGRRAKVGAFKPSRQWVRYNRLQHLEIGYLVPVYDLREIAKRYGLSLNGTTYFRKHLLPEPFDIVRRRNVHAHHWSRFTLMAMDLVLKDLEARGYPQFLNSYTDHIQLLHTGTEYMADFYGDKALYEYAKVKDKYGVSWF